MYRSTLPFLMNETSGSFHELSHIFRVKLLPKLKKLEGRLSCNHVSDKSKICKLLLRGYTPKINTATGAFPKFDRGHGT